MPRDQLPRPSKRRSLPIGRELPSKAGRPVPPNPTDPPAFPRLKRRDRPKRFRIAARLAYDGSGFHGFQRQPGYSTVEGVFLEALTAAGLGDGLSYASRTDTGVHAEGQVVCFRADAGTELPELAQRLAERLPPALVLGELRRAPSKFHPRWSAVSKQYRYRLAWPGTQRLRGWTLDHPLDSALFSAALDGLRLATDLAGFTAAGAPERDGPPLSRLDAIEVEGGLDLVFEGVAFRRYAIRHMVGALVTEGLGLSPPGHVTATATQPPPYRGLRAPADGLVLEEVRYEPPLDPFRDDEAQR